MWVGAYWTARSAWGTSTVCSPLTRPDRKASDALYAEEGVKARGDQLAALD